MLAIAILSMLGAKVLRLVSIKHQNALQTATWQETLLAAESGIDLGIMVQLYGIKPPANSSKHVNLGGNVQIVASVYAPDHDVSINGGGTSGHVFGSVVGKTVTRTGIINNYKIVSWFEDNR